MQKPYKIFFFIILLIIFLFIFIRFLSPKEIDDINPKILCSEKYIEKSDVLWVIPIFNNTPISSNEKWCNYILSLNKSIGMHGVYHNFEEFNNDINQEYLNQGIMVFERCFGFKPGLFKPPQLKISEKNKKLIEENNLELKENLNQAIHKVYHCNDDGLFKNQIIDFF